MTGAARVGSFSDLTDVFLQCRGFQHAFVQVNDLIVTLGLGGTVVEFKRHAKCILCTTEKVTTMSAPDMRTIRRQYRYPDGYLLAKGTSIPGRTHIAGAKAEYLDRVLGRGAVVRDA